MQCPASWLLCLDCEFDGAFVVELWGGIQIQTARADDQSSPDCPPIILFFLNNLRFKQAVKQSPANCNCKRKWCAHLRMNGDVIAGGMQPNRWASKQSVKRWFSLRARSRLWTRNALNIGGCVHSIGPIPRKKSLATQASRTPLESFIDRDQVDNNENKQTAFCSTNIRMPNDPSVSMRWSLIRNSRLNFMQIFYLPNWRDCQRDDRKRLFRYCRNVQTTVELSIIGQIELSFASSFFFKSKFWILNPTVTGRGFRKLLIRQLDET